MIQIEVIGRIGNGGELKQIGQKQAYCFSVAHDETVNGQKQTTWVDVVYYATQSKVIQYLQKGAMVRAYGRAGFRAYTNKSGQTVAGVTVYASDITMLVFPKQDEQPAPPMPQAPFYPHTQQVQHDAPQRPTLPQSQQPFVNPYQQQTQQAEQQFYDGLAQKTQQQAEPIEPSDLPY